MGSNESNEERPKKKTRSEDPGSGSTFTTSGAIPGGSEAGWTTAYPEPDPTKPGTLPRAIAESMEPDPEVEAMPDIEKTTSGPDMSMAGAMPGGSEMSWNTAYPEPDPTKPETMPSSMDPRWTSAPATEEE